MKKNIGFKRILFPIAITFIIVVAIPSLALATNGMGLIGQGINSRGMGGVAAAYPQDSLAGAANPATIVDVETGKNGKRIDAGGDIFNMVRKTSVIQNKAIQNDEGEANTEVKARVFRSDLEYLLFPNMGMVKRYTKNIYGGFIMIPAGGGATYYPENFLNWVGDNSEASNEKPYNPCKYEKDNKLCENKAGTVGIFLAQMNLGPSIAYKFLNNHSIGVSVLFGLQVFNAWGIDNFASFRADQDSNKFTNRGFDLSYGIGAKIGYYGKLFDDVLRIGLSYQSKTNMSAFTKYSQLFAEQGNIDIPANCLAGFALKVHRDLVLAFDIGYTFYEDVKSIANPGPSAEGGSIPEENKLGADNGYGFGWKNQTIYKVGADYSLNKNLKIRAGWNYGKSPIGNNEVLFNTLAPATVQHHLAMGSTYDYSDTLELSVSFVHAFRNRQAGPGMIGDAWAIEMYENILGIGVSFKL